MRMILVFKGTLHIMTTDSDTTFCAGFFEADGCCSVQKSSACLCFYNDNKQVLEKIRDVLSVDNNILSRKKPKGGTSYTLTIGKKKDVARIAEQFLSCRLVTVKRKKLLEARAIQSRPHIRKNGWTEDEDSIIRNTLDKTAKDVVDMLENRTRYAIAWRRHKLGVKASSPRTDIWTEDEDNTLRNTLDMTVREVALMLGIRTTKAVAIRRRKIGVKASSKGRRRVRTINLRPDGTWLKRANIVGTC